MSIAAFTGPFILSNNATLFNYWHFLLRVGQPEFVIMETFDEKPVLSFGISSILGASKRYHYQAPFQITKKAHAGSINLPDRKKAAESLASDDTCRKQQRELSPDVNRYSIFNHMQTLRQRMHVAGSTALAKTELMSLDLAPDPRTYKEETNKHYQQQSASVTSLLPSTTFPIIPSFSAQTHLLSSLQHDQQKNHSEFGLHSF